MDLWRICRSRHATSAFSGSGAEKTGGRWNFKGHAVVYCSENLSLASLELFVHISPAILPKDLVSLRGAIPDSVSIERIKEKELPKNWRTYPAPPDLQTIGTNWLAACSSLVLIVPSAINPVENNLLLNPTHPDIKKLKVFKGKPFHFDPRMFNK